jgi:hypothetical protein
VGSQSGKSVLTISVVIPVSVVSIVVAIIALLLYQRYRTGNSRPVAIVGIAPPVNATEYGAEPADTSAPRSLEPAVVVEPVVEPVDSLSAPVEHVEPGESSLPPSEHTEPGGSSLPHTPDLSVHTEPGDSSSPQVPEPVVEHVDAGSSPAVDTEARV